MLANRNGGMVHWGWSSDQGRGVDLETEARSITVGHGIRVKVLTNRNGGVVYWGWSGWDQGRGVDQ